MAYVSLEELVRREGPRDAHGLHRLAVETMAALAQTHQAGMVHGALAPSAVTMPLGASERAGLLPPGPVIPAYLAPEQVAGQPASYSSDVFAWAAVMVYAATGLHAFGADDVQAIYHRVLYTPADLSRVPEPLRGLLDRCLAKQPEHRPAAQELLAALTGGQPTATQPLPSPSSGKGAVVAIVLVVLVVLGGGVFAAVTWLGGRETPPPVTPSAAVDTPTPAPTGVRIAGTWTGTYQCGQGRTALELTIAEPASSGEIEATFAFKAHSSNPDVPSGSFRMRGRLSGSVLELKGERWIDQPGDYLMVDLRATVEDDRPTAVRGIVDAEGCGTFEVRRS